MSSQAQQQIYDEFCPHLLIFMYRANLKLVKGSEKLQIH